jgi:Ca2+-binding RTX toxin-like protein
MKKGGDHTLTGGEGTDVFEFVHASLRKVTDAVITDFEVGVDLMTIDGVDAVQLYLDDGFLSVEDTADGVVLTLVSNDTITLNGITVAELEAAYLV